MTVPPASIGRYRVQGVLGQGAMGVVYRAHDPAIDRTVAIKLIRADLLATAERAEYLQRFQHEAQAAGRCSHPNIVALHDMGADADGNPFLVMEYVEATSLDRLLNPGAPLPVAESVSIVVQVLDALDCAHRLGVVHRDIKPANILVLDGQRVKVADFGVARLLASDLTQAGVMVGTPSYMSPEQCLGDEAGPQSDLFSVASVLFELLSGTRAFAAGSLARLSLKLAQDTPPPIPGLPPALRAVLDRAHAKQPAARFASAAAMAQALRAAVPTDGPPAQAATVVLPSAAPPAGVLIDPATARLIESALSRAVGPIARHLLQRALAQAGSAEAAVRVLADGIEEPAQRQAFLRATAGTLGGVATGIKPAAAPAPASTLPPEACDRIARELGRHLGPIAPVLVRRAAATAGSVEQLRAALAAHITDDNDRRAFLSGR
jgi:serine/threonine-protein kinase